MKQSPKLTPQTMRVLSALFGQPGSSGADVCRLTSLPSGTVYPILGRLEDAGWLQSRWENVEPSAAGRPRKRFYFLSAQGVTEAKRGAAEAARIYTSFAL